MGEEFVHVLMQKVDNVFWRDVLKHLKKLQSTCRISSGKDFVTEKIFYNKNIMVGKKTIFIDSWLREGIDNVHCLLKQDGTFLTYTEFCHENPEALTNFLSYMVVIRAIKKYQKSLNLNLSSNFEDDEPLLWRVVEKGNGCVHKHLLYTVDSAAGPQRWNRQFQNLEWKRIFMSLRKTTSDVKLRWLQYRIAHRIVPTKRFLHLRKVVDTAVCTFCGLNDETIEHLFFDCVHVQSFWNNLLHNLKNNSSHCDNLTFSKQIILFGVEKNIVTDIVIDLVILLAKYHIYICKWKNQKPDLIVFLGVLKSRYNVEKLSHVIKDMLLVFNTQWMPYLQFVNQ